VEMEIDALERNEYHYERATIDADIYFHDGDFPEALVRYVFALTEFSGTKGKQQDYLLKQIRLICSKKPVPKKLVDRTKVILQAFGHVFIVKPRAYPPVEKHFRTKLRQLAQTRRKEERRLKAAEEPEEILVPLTWKNFKKTIRWPLKELTAEKRDLVELEINRLRLAGLIQFDEAKFGEAEETFQKIGELQKKIRDEAGLKETFAMIQKIKYIKTVNYRRRGRLARQVAYLEASIEDYQKARTLSEQIGDHEAARRCALIIEKMEQDLQYLGIK